MQSTMGPATLLCSASKPMMKPAFTKMPARWLRSTLSAMPRRAFCSLWASTSASGSGLSMPTKTAKKRRARGGTGCRPFGRRGRRWGRRVTRAGLARRLSPAVGDLGGLEVQAARLAPPGGPGPALRAEAGEPPAIHADPPAQLLLPLDGHGVGADREGSVGRADAPSYRPGGFAASESCRRCHDSRVAGPPCRSRVRVTSPLDVRLGRVKPGGPRSPSGPTRREPGAGGHSGV